MGLEGGAFLALWNDRSADRTDYDVWHSREHVPERLGVPGIRHAARYVALEGPLPRYFTLYSLEALSALRDPSYVRLLNEPTPWSRSMRPDFDRFLRLPCRTVRTTGGGLGGWSVVCLTHGAPEVALIEALMRDLLDAAPVNAVHYGSVAAELAHVPFAMPIEPADDADGVLVVEGFEEVLGAEVQALLDRHAGAVRTSRSTLYRLAYALASDQVASVHPFQRRLETIPATASALEG